MINLLKTINAFIAAMLLLPVVAMAEKLTVTPESKQAEEVWNSKFYHQPVEKLYDSRILVKMFLLSGLGKSCAGPRDTAIADLLISYAGSYAVRNCTSVDALYQRAAELKGKPLSDTDRKNIETFHQRFVKTFERQHPDASKFNFLLSGDAKNLKDTIGGTDTVEEAFEEIGKQHGWECDVRSSDTLAPAEIKESLRRGRALIVTPQIKEEKQGGIMKLLPSFSKDRKWYVCFGCYDENGKTYLMLNEPATTTIIRTPPTITKVDRESINPVVISMQVGQLQSTKLPSDIISDTNRKLSSFGFKFEPYEAGKYSYLIVENWRQTSSALDKELCDILKIGLPAKAEKPVLAEKPSAEQLWQYYFYQQRRHIGDQTGLVNTVVLPANKTFSNLTATLSSSALSRNAELGNFALTTSKLLQQSHRNGKLRIPTQGEVDQLALISKKLAEQYAVMIAPVKKELDEISGEDDQGQINIEKIKRRLQADFKTAQIMTEGRTPNDASDIMCDALKLKIFCGNTDSLPEMLDNLARNTGWYALCETQEAAPWEDYQAAIQMKIPIILQSKQNKTHWKLGVGYLRYNNVNLLLTVDPTKIGDQMIFINPQQPFPKQGAAFEPFDAQLYTPYFVHHWEASAKAYRDEVEKICPDTLFSERLYASNLPKARKVMKMFSVEDGSDQKYSFDSKSIFELEKNKTFGGFDITVEDNPYNRDIYLTRKSNKGEKEKAGTIEIRYGNSEKNTRIELSQLILNSRGGTFSIPACYKVWKDGPGELCIVCKDFEETSKTFVPNTKMFFVRNGVAVSIWRFNDKHDLDIEKFARELDQYLIDGQKKFQDASGK